MVSNVEAKIEQAQNTLTEINQAINRDTLLAEQKIKDLVELDKGTKFLLKDIDTLEEKKSTLKASLSSAEEKHKAELADIASTKAKLQSEIAELQDKVVEETNSLIDSQEKFKKQTIEINKALEITINNATTKSQEIMAEIVKHEELSKIAKKEYETLLEKKVVLNLSIAETQKKLDGENLILANILVNTNKLQGLEEDVKHIEETIATLRKQEEAMKATMIITRNSLAEVSGELAKLSTEKDAIIKDKFELTEKTIALNQREEKVRFAFEQAGIAR